MAKLVNKTQNKILFEKLEIANDFLARTKGLLGQAKLENSQALYIRRCNAIHTFFMKFAIDVAFVNDELIVKKVIRNISPGRATWPVFTAKHVFEAAAGTLTDDRIRVGDQLHVDR